MARSSSSRAETDTSGLSIKSRKTQGTSMGRILSCIATLAVAGTLGVAVFTVATMWALNRSSDRTACYRTATSVDACGTPSGVERVLAHYVAHVDL